MICMTLDCVGLMSHESFTPNVCYYH